MAKFDSLYDDTGAYIGPEGDDPLTDNMQLIHNQLASLNNRLSSMDGRLNAMDNRLTSIDNRLNSSDTQTRDTDQKIFSLSRNVWILIGGIILLGWIATPFLNAYAKQIFSYESQQQTVSTIKNMPEEKTD